MRSRYHHLKPKIVALRKLGKTYTEICKIVGIKISKGTLSDWCGNISLSFEQKQRVARLIKKGASRGRATALVINKLKRDKYLKSLVTNNKHLADLIKDKDVAKIALAILYLGEGAKWKSHRGLMLGNADPKVIHFYLNLLNKCYGITPERLHCRISYRADQDIKKLMRFWSYYTQIPLKNFYKTKPDPRTKGKPTRRKDYKGVCVVTLGSTAIQLELELIAEILFRACGATVAH